MKIKHASLRLISLILTIIIACALIASCDASPSYNGGGTGRAQSRMLEDYYFASFIKVMDYSGSTTREFDHLCERVASLADEYHNMFDIYNAPDSVVGIKKLNENAGITPIVISETLMSFLEYCKEIFRKTDGNTNIAMGSVLKIWHNYREEGVAIPTMAELEAAAAHTNIDNLILNRENMTAYISDQEMSLDVGAIAKGYSCARISDILRSEGYTSIVLDFGGNLSAIGSKQDGSSWTTGVRDPRDPSGFTYAVRFTLKNASVATSGDYERGSYYEVNGVRYHHLISKDTLMPATYHSSVSVVSPDAGLCDALSTALFCISESEGKSLINRNFSDSVTQVYWISTSGEVSQLYG